MQLKPYFAIVIILILAGCAIPVDVVPPPTALPTATLQPTLTAPSTFTPIPALTQPASPTPTLPASTSAPSYCDDPGPRGLIDTFGTAVGTQDGLLLASLVSPAAGMDVRFYRDGNVINYDVEHVQFVFETTFQADWGLSFGSGQPTIGSFQEIVLPSLQKVFVPASVRSCNEIKTGGATYLPKWPYPGMNYYSVYFAGSDQNGGLDWQTWVVGMDNIKGKPFIAALVHFEWEP